MSSPALSSALQDAELLLRYASGRGLQIPPDVALTIISSKTLLSQDDKDPSTYPQQQAFWAALTALTMLAAPASIDSMAASALRPASLHSRLWARLTGRPEPTRLSQGDHAVRQGGVFALVVLVIVGFLQLYADVGSSTIHDYAVAKLQYETNRRILQASHTENGTEAESKLSAETNALLDQTTRRVQLLDVLMRVVPKSLWPPQSTGTQQQADQVLAKTELVLLVLRGFLLPVGWGLLGAALYVSRTTAEEIRTISYSANNARFHLSRYFLGAVAGFVVAKFSVALSGKQIEDAVQPLVLALLVGYSVDVLFGMLDKLIYAFSSKQSVAKNVNV